MIDYLIKYFDNYVALEEEERGFIRGNISVREVLKDEILLSEGEVSTEFYFIIKGCIRLFYTVDVEEKTAFFYTENMFVSSYESFTKQTPSKHYLQAIEPTKVATISFDVAYRLIDQFPKFEFLARVMMEEELIVYQEIISSFVTLNAEQRYLKLLSSNKSLLQRIPQYQLATFLGVTPETLSRIRKRVSSKPIS
ncbi:MAG: Crp/Fnr family transcriptional regulator [Cyclobacteriaceae bacterium]